MGIAVNESPMRTGLGSGTTTQYLGVQLNNFWRLSLIKILFCREHNTLRCIFKNLVPFPGYVNLGGRRMRWLLRYVTEQLSVML